MNPLEVEVQPAIDAGARSATFWDAATHHAATTIDRTTLAYAANMPGRYRHAYELCHAVADTGDIIALRYLDRSSNPNHRDHLSDML
ncbi:hypothetical protein ABZT47_40120 [Sphaerisporangium sp. NPDC005289]|uniref:hypothetical protein n=1 Tax=Sphaerisporangium sp. NPDC005289 TaxID=3155247 RepID=UPI0033B460FC